MITKHPTSRTLIVHPLGDLDTLRAEHYRRQLRSLIDEGYRFLIFDLQDTPFINSSGLGLLIELYNTTTRQEGSLKLINCSPQVLWILEQTQLNRILIEPNVPTAEEQAQSLNFDSIYNYMSDEVLLLAHVHDVTEKILGQEDPAAIGDSILNGLAQALRASRGVFLLLAPDSRSLSVSSWFSRDGHNGRPGFDEIPVIAGRLEARLLDEAQSSWHYLSDEDRRENNLFHRLGYETLLAAPIRGRERRFGLLAIEAGEETGQRIQASKPLVRTFTNVCGVAMEKVMMARELREQNQTLIETIERGREYQHALMDGGRLASLGVIVSGLGHLINNKMVPLTGYAQMLAQKNDLPDWSMEKIQRIQEASREIGQIVDKLVRIGRLRDRANSPLDHAELIRSALDLLAYKIEHHGVLVHMELAADQPVIIGNPDLLLQALLAILHRACTSFEEREGEHWIRIGSTATPEGLRIVIEDNGAGFDEYDQDGWLDPMVPTEAMSSGRLFNYTIPRGIVRKHHGRLSLEPTEGDAGKRVIIDLPATPTEA